MFRCTRWLSRLLRALARVGADCTVVMLWERPEDAAALEDSDRYLETVAAIMATGFCPPRRADPRGTAGELTENR